ncbi:dolichyl-phosphate-mannose--protein mannosyltransferase [Leptospira fluminis]|uniref:Dolichyl-phosphate-mannose--protein mannosyltransferase n=1 Tax=Leptospira fluminis TaxID=2484979 RepID=A0A4R9GMA8_9LEPT|nr:dolichyl-phosphate-mannose--protein mannosyltransferase [Leptospira fluminis]TGK17320.1 dolichyl-phosphate-mannose--protein mannosyltransferase [Leptospira fluminis]
MKISRIQFLFLALGLGLAAYFLKNLIEFYGSFLHWPAYLSLDASQLRAESALILRGKLPYLDFYSFNLPGTHWTNLILMAGFGSGDFGIRFSELVWMLICDSLLVFYLYRNFGTFSAFVGGLLFLTLPEEAAPYGSFQRETIFLLPLLVFWNLLSFRSESETGADPRRARLFRFAPIYSALFVFSVLIKPFFGLFFGFAFLEEAFRIWKESEPQERSVFFRLKKDEIRSLLFCVLTGFGVFLFLFWPAFVSGKPRAVFEALYWNVQSHNRWWVLPSWKSAISSLVSFSPSEFFLPLSNAREKKLGGYFVLVLLAFVLTKKYKEVPFSISFLAAGILSYWIQRRGFHYYLIPAWTILQVMAAILIGFGAETTARHLKMESRDKPLSTHVWILLFLALLYASFRRQEIALGMYRGNGLVGPRLAQGWQPFRLYEELDRIVPELRKTRGRISYLCLDSATFSLAAVLRYDLEFDSFFTLDYGLWSGTPEQEFLRKRLVSEWDRSPFDLIVVSNDPIQWKEGEKKGRWSYLKERLEKEYDSVSSFEDVTGSHFEIFRRKKSI